jgi:hypothetical protein
MISFISVVKKSAFLLIYYSLFRADWRALFIDIHRLALL